MSFLPEFEDDIFINYSHIDDKPLTEGQKGWISSFHHALEIRLAQLLAPEPKVWRDKKLTGNDFFEDKLISHIPKIAILLSVVSPPYLNSEWCIREMKEFYRVAETRGGIRFHDKSLIFKVLKTSVAVDNQPPEMQGLLGYEFYEVENQTGKSRDFDPEVYPDTKPRYWKKLDDLAHDIQQLLVSLKRPQRPDEPDRAEAANVAVYLAETTFDLRDERDSIRRDLQQRGYTVLPDAQLPSNADDFKRVVGEYLRRSSLSIHLIGDNYGDIPRTETRSHVYLQNEIAATQSADLGFSRLIWIPLDSKGSDPRQREFIQHLQTDSAAQHGAELLQTTIEELKQIAQDKLNPRKKVTAPAAPAPTPGSPKQVYIVCDREDVRSVAPLKNHLFDLGYEPVLPRFEGSEIELREDHKDNLLLCDAYLIYYGAATEFWLRSKLKDLLKIAGYGRNKPMLATCVYIGPDESPEKHEFRTHNAAVIKNFDEFTPESLAPFIAQFARTQTAKGGHQ